MLIGGIQDDKRSLAAIHQLLRTSDEWDSASEEQSESSKAERRRSLPITKKDSLLSLRSVAALSPEQTEFQLRRKRAAKLAGFFGVDYNRLFEDVLAAFELGVVEESGRGSLRPHETEVRTLLKLYATSNSPFASRYYLTSFEGSKRKMPCRNICPSTTTINIP
jgi:hypothetical protein